MPIKNDSPDYPLGRTRIQNGKKQKLRGSHTIPSYKLSKIVQKKTEAIKNYLKRTNIATERNIIDLKKNQDGTVNISK